MFWHWTTCKTIASRWILETKLETSCVYALIIARRILCSVKHYAISYSFFPSKILNIICVIFCCQLLSWMSVASQCSTCFCVVLCVCFCHGAFQLDIHVSTLLTLFFLWTSLHFIFPFLKIIVLKDVLGDYPYCLLKKQLCFKCKFRKENTFVSLQDYIQIYLWN